MENQISRRELFANLWAPAQKEQQVGTMERLEAPEDYPVITSGLTPYTGVFGREELLHLLKRTVFGVSKQDLDYFAGKSLSQVLDTLFTYSTVLPSTPLNNYDSQASTGGSPDYAGVALGQTWVNNVCPASPFEATYDNFYRDLSVKYWNMGLVLNQSRTIYEKLVLFWHNHFPISVSLLNRAQRSYVYTKTIRENVNASLRDLCKLMTKDPAMLMYLNGEVNTKNAPDENYARELQELFTIGKELPADKRYTEEDVKAAAKVLTGHRMGTFTTNYLDAVYAFSTSNHATGNKTFSAFYSNTVIKGSTSATATSGEDELNQLLDMIFDDTDKNIAPLVGTVFAGKSRADIIADYLCKKIYRFFVYYDIDDNIQNNVIDKMAAVFKKDFKIAPVLKELLGSQHFYDIQNRGCYIKMPMDVVVGLLRATNANLKDADVKKQYAIWASIFSQAESMQQGYLEPPNIAGWSAYYQAPNYHELWINSDALPKRQSFAQLYAGNTPRGVFTLFNIKLDHIAFVKTLTNPEDPNALIDELCDLFLGIKLTAAHKQKLKTDTLLNKQTTDYYWTDAWARATAANATTNDKNTVVGFLRNLMDYLVRLEEFQLM